MIDDGTEKVWKDYSISEQLVLHNMYAVDREDIEYFMPPEWVPNQVYFSDKLKNSDVSATKVRFGNNKKELFEICYPSVAKQIIKKQYWNYSS